MLEHLTPEERRGLLALVYISGVALAGAVKMIRNQHMHGLTLTQWRDIILWPVSWIWGQ